MKAMDRIETRKDGEHYFLGHKEVTEAEYRAVYPKPEVGNPGDCFGGNATTGWPIHSEALAYHPKQKKEAEAHLQKLGVPTQIDLMGRPILRDRSHRRNVLKALKLHDNNSFTGY